MRGWLTIYRRSVGLGIRYLLRHGYQREALARVVVPLEPARYGEFPATLRALGLQRPSRLLDLASPKLLAVHLAREGHDVVSVDRFEHEVETWRKLAGHVPGVSFAVGDGRRLDYPDESFDAAYSVSVLEHIPDEGDAAALIELGRVVRQGGRVAITVPTCPEYHEEWRAAPVYGSESDATGPGPQPQERFYHQRCYDDARLQWLAAAAAPELELVDLSIAHLRPVWLAAQYDRLFPWSMLLGPFWGILLRERRGRAAVAAACLTFVRCQAPAR